MGDVVRQKPAGSSVVRYGRALARAKRTEEAERVLRGAIEQHPGLADAYFHLGVLLEEKGRLEEASGVLEEGLKREERQPVLTILGSVQRRLGDLASAARSFRRSLALNSRDDEAHFGLGLVLRDTDPLEAAKHLRETLALDPGFPRVQRELGHALWRAGLDDDAEEAFRAAIHSKDGDAWAHDYLGHLLGAKGDWAAAQEAFASATKHDPTIGYFWANLAEASALLGAHGEADRAYRHALSLGTDDPHTNLKYGLFLKKVGRLGRASVYLKRALSLDPADKRAREALRELDDSRQDKP